MANLDFEFNATCPIIDGNISSIKNGIEEVFSQMNRAYYDYLAENNETLFERIIDELYKDYFEEYIEEIRETNSKMRDAANSQLLNLANEYEEKIGELKDKIYELEELLQEKEIIINSLEIKQNR